MGNRANIPATGTRDEFSILELTCPRDGEKMIIYRKELPIYYYLCPECCFLIWLSEDNHTYEAAAEKMAARLEAIRR